MNNSSNKFELVQRTENINRKETTSQRQSSVSCDKKSTFDDDIFRRKKKMIVKERLKQNPVDSICKTPLKIQHQHSPNT